MVSILVPIYNAEKYLSQCLDSIVNQTYKDLQVVLINDGSKDNSWQICQDYVTKYDFVEAYTQDNQGVAETRNRLLSYVKGDYVLFVDADDWVESNMVKFLFDSINDNNAEISVCSSVFNDNEMLKEAKRVFTWDRNVVIYEFLRHVNFNGSLWNKLIKSSLLTGLTFRKDISYGEDALFMWQVIQNVNKVAISNNPLYHYRMNDNSISHQFWTPDKKGTDHYVWEEITNDVAVKFPQYLDISKARFALQDMWALFFASLCKYPCDDEIKLRQQNVKTNLITIWKSHLVGFDKFLTAFLLSYCYKSGIILRNIKG